MFVAPKVRSSEEYLINFPKADDEETKAGSDDKIQFDGLQMMKINSQIVSMTDGNGIIGNSSSKLCGSPLQIGKPIRKAESNNSVLSKIRLSAPIGMNRKEQFRMKL